MPTFGRQLFGPRPSALKTAKPPKRDSGGVFRFLNRFGLAFCGRFHDTGGKLVEVARALP